ncbi:hypothetical protein IV454_07710 [Massilia antarctica]|uniref:FAD assembly factor SdhE n=1 Tax=Massilia antarctica TaxID=2765360 RepID=A0AA49A994_9BURK|nr:MULTISPECIES: hypothetical protein [Massilia]MCY0912222.1 hypothetical protein [Massilia sp. H27-R4]QPI51393.1 hypothetical protein IV454_07710 [Massilia antarctica]CUI06286.1 hypothetical protein BN2497_7349 [Janthinobacterium sp. CG23_2]CUU30072.1 hypothetical protein BN3177_7349 [Janthinobacterium sp. CG23_2]
MTDSTNSDVTLTLTLDESIVLFEFLQRFSHSDQLTIEDQAEARALWNLCCLFEKTSFIPFENTYHESLQAARDRLRDKDD